MSQRKKALIPIVVGAAVGLCSSLTVGAFFGRATAQTPPPPTPVAASESPAACVPDDVRFNAKFGTPTWVDPQHANGRALYTIRAPKATLRLAVASDTRERARGLMCVTQIPAFNGMLFAFPNEQQLAFWMKDTLVPLDMVFVHANGVVSNVAEDVPSTTPATPDDAIPRREASGSYVIELAAGDAARAGIVRGTKLALPKIGSQ
jgi:uncharacterized membrane protein (UPF0127 family)